MSLPIAVATGVLAAAWDQNGGPSVISPVTSEADRTRPAHLNHIILSEGSAGAAVEQMVDESAGEAAVDRAAPVDLLYDRVYDQLKTLARRVRAGRAGETLNTTALVNEAYLKLAAGKSRSWNDRAHFFAIAARAMRQILVDGARRRMASKRGGAGRWMVSLDEAAHPAPMRPEHLMALDEALSRLAKIDPRRATVVEYRYFAGLTAAETAKVLQVSSATIERDWRTARAWLASALKDVAP